MKSNVITMESYINSLSLNRELEADRQENTNRTMKAIQALESRSKAKGKSKSGVVAINETNVLLNTLHAFYKSFGLEVSAIDGKTFLVDSNGSYQVSIVKARKKPPIETTGESKKFLAGLAKECFPKSVSEKNGITINRGDCYYKVSFTKKR